MLNSYDPSSKIQKWKSLLRQLNNISFFFFFFFFLFCLMELLCEFIFRRNTKRLKKTIKSENDAIVVSMVKMKLFLDLNSIVVIICIIILDSLILANIPNVKTKFIKTLQRWEARTLLLLGIILLTQSPI